MVGWRAVLLVTIVKSSEVDCAVDDELIEAAAPLSNTPTVFELAVGRAFKWDRGAPQWAAAFVASNDAIPRLADLCITLRSLEAAGMELSMVAVAGGLGVQLGVSFDVCVVVRLFGFCVDVYFGVCLGVCEGACLVGVCFGVCLCQCS